VGAGGGPRLELQQRRLALQAAAVAGERSVGADDAVARDHDRHRRAADGGADGAHAVGPPHGAGELRVTDGRAVGNPCELAPDTALKRRAADVERELERRALAREVLRELRANRGERVGAALGLVAPRPTPGERDRAQPGGAAEQGQRPERALEDVPGAVGHRLSAHRGR
jgi:hypothetical protein